MSLVEIWVLDEAGIAAATNTTLTPTWTAAPAYKPANGSPETVSMLFNPASPPFINRQLVIAMVLNATS